jgi:hypothetical protein
MTLTRFYTDMMEDRASGQKLSDQLAKKTAIDDTNGREINVMFPPSPLIGASGSSQTTTGSITTNTNTITVTSVTGFKVNQGISIKTSDGVSEVVSLQITAGATGTGEVKLWLGDSIYLVPVTAGDTAIQVADKIRATPNDSYTVGGTSGTDTVTFTAKLVGKRPTASYTSNSTGATGSLIVPTTGSNSTYFVSKITAINGTSITVADTYTGSTISDKTVYHDDTAAIQAVIDYIGTNYTNGGKIIIPQGYTFRVSSVRVKTKHIHITGGGIIDGEILIKSVDSVTAGIFNIVTLNTKIENVKFISSKNFIGNAAIRIQYMRDAIIKGCYFEKYETGVLGESLVEDFQYQQTARVRVVDCTFYNVDFAVKTKYKPWYSGISPNWVYYQHGDWTTKGCYSYADFLVDGTPTGVTPFHFEGQDGLILKDNFTFHHQFTAGWNKKRYCLYLKQSNYALISDNNFFEPGYEAAYIEDYRVLNFHDNHMTRVGQIRPSSGVYVETIDSSTTSSSSAKIIDNDVNGGSKHGVEIGFNPINVKVAGNNLFQLGSSGSYYGSASIPTAYSVYTNYGGTTFTDKDMIVVTGNMSDKQTNLNRGLRYGDFYKSYVNAFATFGNVNTSALAPSGALDFKGTIGGAAAQPFNQNFPYVFKNVTGTISSITGAGTNQILVLVVGSGGLTITHNTSGANNVRLKAGANQTYSQYATITLMHTDDLWIEI